MLGQAKGNVSTVKAADGVKQVREMLRVAL
jgi:hypothetical protein